MCAYALTNHNLVVRRPFQLRNREFDKIFDTCVDVSCVFLIKKNMYADVWGLISLF